MSRISNGGGGSAPSRLAKYHEDEGSCPDIGEFSLDLARGGEGGGGAKKEEACGQVQSICAHS